VCSSDLGLFDGTAEDYDRYRLPYPDALIERIREDLQAAVKLVANLARLGSLRHEVMSAHC